MKSLTPDSHPRDGAARVLSSHARPRTVSSCSKPWPSVRDEVAARFTLLVPAEVHGLHRVVDPEEHGVADAEHRIARSVPLLSRAAGSEVRSMIGSHNPVAAVADAINLCGFDEVIVSMLQPRVSRWLHLDLARKVAAMGVPVTTVVATSGPRRLAA